MWHQPYTTLRDAFLFHVQVADLDECWYWVGSLSPSGYGQLSWQSRHYWAHQLAYRFWHGPIIYRDVGNTCGNKACCNPTHLFNAPHSVAVRNGMALLYRNDAELKAQRDAVHKQLTAFKSSERARLRKERDERRVQERAARPPRVLLTEEEKREHRRAYYRRPDIAAKKRAFHKAYYKTPKGIERKRQWEHKYDRTPKGRLLKKLAHARRMARKYGNGQHEGELILKWELKWRKRKRVKCYWCQDTFSPKQCHTDHIEALANGGTHTLGNVCISCMECNCVKFTKSFKNWNRWLEQPALL